MTSIIAVMQQWLNTCPYMDQFSCGIHIDWTDCTNGCYGLAPVGCSDVSIDEDVSGCIVKTKQYNLVLYARNWTINDVIRLENTEFLENFQEWVDQQQYTGQTPKFGDDPEEEIITAQNGMLYLLDPNGQSGVYQVQISITFEKHYERM